MIYRNFDVELVRPSTLLTLYLLKARRDTVSQPHHGTATYRRTGEDSLNYGDPDEWSYTNLGPATLKPYRSFWQKLAIRRKVVLGMCYEYRNPKGIETFLGEYPHLGDILIEGYPIFDRHFGDDGAQYVLELVRDPDDYDFSTLALFIRTHLPVPEARERLAQIDKDRFLDQVPTVGSQLALALEFQ